MNIWSKISGVWLNFGSEMEIEANLWPELEEEGSNGSVWVCGLCV